MPSTETRRYADLITLIRETVNDAEDDFKHIPNEIWDLANKEEKEALKTFSSWFFKHLDE